MKKNVFKKMICLCVSILLLVSALFVVGCAKEGSANGTWLVNDSAPTASSEGNVGDMWLDTSTYDIYQMTEDGWLLCGNIKAEDGEDGKNGNDGTDGTNGADGATWMTGEGSPNLSAVKGKIGDFYLDTKNLKIYKMGNDNEWEFLMTLGAISNPTENYPWKEDDALKILLVGNSFSDDTSYYLWKIANSAGVKNVTIGHLHIGGCNLDTHLANAQNDAPAYDYRLTDDSKNGEYTTTTKYKFSDAVKSENWDFISFQQVSGNSGKPETFTALPELIEIYSGYCPTAQIVWNMTWAYEGDSTHANFANYNNDQTVMYNAIVNAVKTTILTNPDVDLISPTGTAVQKARAVLGDTATRDGFHLAYEGSMGTGTYNARYLAGLAFFGKLSGVDLEKVTYAPANVDSQTKAVFIEAATSAIAEMFNTQNPPVEEDPYELLPIEWNEGKQYVSTLIVNCTKLQSGTNYFATQRFTKDTLPVGSVIEVATGWTYRPEGWINDAKNTTETRPAEVTVSRTVIDEAWWGTWTTRAFNIRKIDDSDLTGKSAEVAAAFKIYVPKK